MSGLLETEVRGGFMQTGTPKMLCCQLRRVLSGLSVYKMLDLPIQIEQFVKFKKVNRRCILLVLLGQGGPTPCLGMTELPRIRFEHERGNIRSTRLALVKWVKRGWRKK